MATAKDLLDQAVELPRPDRASLARDLIASLDDPHDAPAAHPEAWPAIAREGGATLRRFLLPRFPYSVIFAIRAEELFVIAVAHDKRRPGYWHDRITSSA